MKAQQQTLFQLQDEAVSAIIFYVFFIIFLLNHKAVPFLGTVNLLISLFSCFNRAILLFIPPP